MAPSDPVVSFKTPKLTVIAASNIALTKALHRLDEEFLLSILAGFYIGFGGFYSLAVAGAVPGFTELHIKGIQRLCLGALFPIALMLIVMTGAELWTGNTFIMTVGLLTKKVTGRQVLRNWVVTFFGNFIGAALSAYFFGILSGLVTAEPLRTYASDMAYAKIELIGWGEVLLRGIACNWLVCLAIWFSIASEDIISKIVGIWWPVSAFVVSGFEHVIANMFFCPIGLMAGANTTFWRFLGFNLVPSMIGNFIGGAFFCGFLNWWVYGRVVDDARLKTIDDKLAKREAAPKTPYAKTPAHAKTPAKTTGGKVTFAEPSEPIAVTSQTLRGLEIVSVGSTPKADVAITV